MTGELVERELENSLNVEVGVKSRKRWKQAGVRVKAHSSQGTLDINGKLKFQFCSSLLNNTTNNESFQREKENRATSKHM